jgi:hypothetical protein
LRSGGIDHVPRRTKTLLEGGRGTDLEIARARSSSPRSRALPIERDIDSGLHRFERFAATL